MGSRFTDRQLFAVRNHIPIRLVVESLLDMPSKTVEGVFRFLCPQCGEYETAIKPETNLARCFRCARNFNPIDMVMAVRRTDFVETVDLLIHFKNAMPSFEKPLSRGVNGLLDNCEPPVVKSQKAPVVIGDVLAQLTGSVKCGDIRKISNKKRVIPQISLEDEIAELEQIVDLLSQTIKRLKSSLRKEV